MLKKMILKLIPQTPMHKLPFWRDLERRNKIKRLGDELEEVKSFTVVCQYEEIDLVAYDSFEAIYKIAKEQQRLLQKK